MIAAAEHVALDDTHAQRYLTVGAAVLERIDRAALAPVQRDPLTREHRRQRLLLPHARRYGDRVPEVRVDPGAPQVGHRLGVLSQPAGLTLPRPSLPCPGLLRQIALASRRSGRDCLGHAPSPAVLVSQLSGVPRTPADTRPPRQPAPRSSPAARLAPASAARVAVLIHALCCVTGGAGVTKANFRAPARCPHSGKLSPAPTQLPLSRHPALAQPSASPTGPPPSPAEPLPDPRRAGYGPSRKPRKPQKSRKPRRPHGPNPSRPL